MTDRNQTGGDKPPSKNYSFIKETIKKRPTDRGAAARKLLLAVFCGLIFGSCAALAFAALLPQARRLLGQDEESRAPVTLVPSEQDGSEAQSAAAETEDEEILAEAGESFSDGAGDTEAESAGSGGNLNDTTAGEAEDGQQEEITRKKILQAAENPRKALVRVSVLSDNSDLLDDSLLNYGNEEGLIFLRNEENFYIMTVFSDMQSSSKRFQVTFSDGAVAEGDLCKRDSRTGLTVIRVSLSSLDGETAEIEAAELEAEDELEQTSPVIAVGSPSGDVDSVVYGTITSVSGRLDIADEDYRILTTDMVGSSEGSGFLLDMSGHVAGIILKRDGEEANVIRAAEVSQLRPLLEILSNGESIRYIGIQGATISAQQSENLSIPQGVYVDSLEDDSPAIAAGLQDGDIIHSLDGQETLTMDEYTAILQTLPLNESCSVEIYRRNPSGQYVNVKLKITVEEK